MTDHGDIAIRQDLEKFKQEIIHQFHVVSEGLIDQIKLLAEGHSRIISHIKIVDERLDRMEKGYELLAGGQLGITQRLDRVETGLAHVETRLDHVETKLSNVETRLDHVETKLDHMQKENDRQHVETRALVKLSFSELDKRLSGLESQVKDLQEWRRKVASRLQI